MMTKHLLAGGAMGGKEAVVHVDADSGQVVGQPEEVAKGKLDSEDKTEVGDLRGAKTSPTDAVDKAGGKAMDARLTTRKGRPVYEVEAAEDGSMSMVMVDPGSGNVTSTTTMQGK
jgi:uncharacterized membrane protein YkoI